VIDGKKRELLVIVRDVTDRKRMEDEALQYQNALKGLHVHATQLAVAESVDEIANITHQTLIDIFGHDRGSLGIVEEGWLYHRYLWNMGQREPFRMPLDGGGLTVLAVRTGQSQLVQDVSSNDAFVMIEPIPDNITRSELVVPVKVEGRVVAVLNLESTVTDAFSNDNLSIVEIFSEHVAGAFERLKSQRELAEIRERHSRELVKGIQQVSSMVRHDLRGPLQTIINANYLLGNDPDSFDEMRELITSSVKHSNEIMEDWENQGIDEQLTLSDIDIRALIEETLDISLIPSEVKVSQNVLPRVLCLDRVKTRRVLDNLIRNAVEAMPKGGVLSIEGRVDGDDYVLEVKDTGVGISGDGLSRVFEPFYTTKPDGRGLGLAFCKRAVEAHGGSISVETEIGEGTKFTIRLPRAAR
jgi:signal transduction histidine kinase